jgi:N-acetylmuramoyl-L-alanine amidase
VKKIVALIVFSLLLVFVPKKSEQHVKWGFNYTMKTIVIDAGHGGHDGGCHGVSAHEKNVTLSVALKLGALLEKNIPGLNVIYTRKTDAFVELHERAAIANRYKADLFVSIHCNANNNTSAYGTESWTMGLHKSEGNLDVAKRENSAILMEKNYDIHYEGFDPNSPEAYIMFSLNQNAFIDQSLMLAANVEDEFKKDGRFSRGVKQAGFLVLWRTTMPAILIETGFLTNSNEEQYLASEKGQNELTQSIFTAIKNYKIKVEGEVNALFSNQDRTVSVKNDQGNIVESTDPKKIDTVQSPAPDKTTADHKTTPSVYYSVQLAASKNQINIKTAPYSDVQMVRVEADDSGYFRVFAGKHSTKKAAMDQLDVLVQKGFKGCFIVGFENGKRFVVH